MRNLFGCLMKTLLFNDTLGNWIIIESFSFPQGFHNKLFSYSIHKLIYDDRQTKIYMQNGEQFLCVFCNVKIQYGMDGMWVEPSVGCEVITVHGCSGKYLILFFWILRVVFRCYSKELWPIFIYKSVLESFLQKSVSFPWWLYLKHLYFCFLVLNL